MNFDYLFVYLQLSNVNPLEIQHIVHQQPIQCSHLVHVLMKYDRKQMHYFVNRILFYLQATSQQTATDNENELDATRMSGGNQSDDGRQQTFNNYVTNRVSIHCKIEWVENKVQEEIFIFFSK